MIRHVIACCVAGLGQASLGLEWTVTGSLLRHPHQIRMSNDEFFLCTSSNWPVSIPDLLFCEAY